MDVQNQLNVAEPQILRRWCGSHSDEGADHILMVIALSSEDPRRDMTTLNNCPDLSGDEINGSRAAGTFPGKPSMP